MPRPLGFATVTILRALADGVRYGLDIMDRTGLPSGTVYPALQRLERMGHVTARWEPESVARAEGRPQRRYYRLTGAGASALSAAIRRYGALVSDTRGAAEVGASDATGASDAGGASAGGASGADGPGAGSPRPERA